MVNSYLWPQISKCKIMASTTLPPSTRLYRYKVNEDSAWPLASIWPGVKNPTFEVYAWELLGVAWNACNGLTPTVALQLAAVVYGENLFSMLLEDLEGCKGLDNHVFVDVECIEELQWWLVLIVAMGDKCMLGRPPSGSAMEGDLSDLRSGPRWMADSPGCRSNGHENSMKRSRGLLSPAVTLNSVSFDVGRFGGGCNNGNAEIQRRVGSFVAETKCKRKRPINR
eukprot:Gb_01355 [translate_table: standard]